MATLCNIPLSSIRTNDGNPRKHFNNVTELAQNISEVGLIQPITVRPVANVYRIICGHRRYLACKELGWTEIPANVFESDGGNDDWWMLSENLQREDLTDSEKGDSVQRVRMEHGVPMSNRDFAKKLGVSHMAVNRWLQAAGYPEEVKEMTKTGTVTDKAVSPIAQLSTPQEQIKTAEYIRDNDLGYTAAKSTVDIIKEMPQPIRSKLTEEPSYTVSDAKTEYAECIVETEDEYFDGKVNYETLKPTMQQCKNMLTTKHVMAMSGEDRIILKADLYLLKVAVDELMIAMKW